MMVTDASDPKEKNPPLVPALFENCPGKTGKKCGSIMEQIKYRV
jgi:hypothetical protein